MIYDKLNDTLHNLPCKIRGLAVSTSQSADDEFLARADLRWATQAEIDEYEQNLADEREAREAEREAVRTGLRDEIVAICNHAGIPVPANPDELDESLSPLTDKQLATETSIRLLNMRTVKLPDAGFSWGEVTRDV